MECIKCLMKFYAAILNLFIMALCFTTAAAQSENPEDKTLSPYFFIKSDVPSVDQMPLKATSVSVNISGVIADVKVTQVYNNTGKKAIEAIYVFPASTRAAVYGMKMTIGKRVIEARINKREDARRVYEKAKEEGKSASFLEQQRPNVFQMNVANIMPGDEIRVELKYTETLVPVDRIYEFVYPTVVGPRYSNQKSETAPDSQKWSQNPYLLEGEMPSYTFDIAVNISAGMPIKELTSPTHKITPSFSGASMAKVTVDEKLGGNRDYILRYRLAGDAIKSGLLLYEGEKENFFLLMMQPPQKVTNAEIPGREYIFVVDVSGSMYGFPLEISKKLLKNLIGSLRQTDKFNVLLFSGGSALMAEHSVSATAENINDAIIMIDKLRGSGSTELLPALKRVLGLRKTEGFSRTIVIATDGYLTVEEEVFDLIRKNLGDANIFSFGIGTSVNRHIIEGMAHVGMGESFVITRQNEADAQSERFRKMIQSPVLTNVRINFWGLNVYDLEPLAVPDVLAERPVIVFGKYRGKAQGKITLSGTSGGGVHRETIDAVSSKPSELNSALRYLWARHRITMLSDYNMLKNSDKRVNEVAELGLKYNLLTAYTSFVAVDTETRNKEGKSEIIKQPLPLPEGVSNLSIASGKVKTYPKRPKSDLAEKRSISIKPVSIEIVDLTVSGMLTKDEILKIVQKKTAELQRCILNGKQGRLVLKVTIKPDGKVKDVTTMSSTLNDKGIEKCISEEAKNWQFTVSEGGEGTTVTMTIEVK